ncbi:hypothetical protein AB0I38_03565 [Nonomuraea cavernae]
MSPDCARCSPNCSATRAPCSAWPNSPRAPTSATTWADARRTRWLAGSPRTWNCTPPTGPVRLAELTRTARPLLLDLTEGASLAETLAVRHDQVDIVAARSQTPAPTALLLRPDCYVAWASASPRPDPTSSPSTAYAALAAR